MSQQASIASAQTSSTEPQQASERALLRARRLRAETWGGTWCAQVYERFDSQDGNASDFPAADQNGYGCRILLRFKPKAPVSADKIGLVQRTMLRTDGATEDARWADKFSAPASRAAMTDAELCKHSRSNGSSHIDRGLYLRNPVYGAPDAPVSDDIEALRAALAQTEAGGLKRNAVRCGVATPGRLRSGTKYQIGHRKPRALPLLHSVKEARLFDQPCVQNKGPATRHEFETAAVELQAHAPSSAEGGSKTSSVRWYGSVRWGYEIVNGQVQLLPFVVESYEHASGEMQECVRAWNAARPAYQQEHHPRVRNVQLPDVPAV